MPDQTSILNLLIYAIRDRLTDKLITAFDGDPDPEDEAQAGLVLVGKLQEDPTDTLINIIIREGNDLDDWRHSLNVSDPKSGWAEQIYEIGGPYPTVTNKRRYVIQLRLFYESEFDPDVARTKSNVILSRVEHALWTMSLGGIGRDSFGESPHAVEISESYLRQSGGPGTYIFKGEIKLAFVTSFDPEESLA